MRSMEHDIQCDEYAPGDPFRMAMSEYWKEAEADGC